MVELTSAEDPLAGMEDAQKRRAHGELFVFRAIGASVIVSFLLIGLSLLGNGLPYPGFASMAFGVAAGVLLIFVGGMRSEALLFQAARDRLQARLDAARSDSKYFDELVNINVVNLQDYYRLVGVQASRSFFASLFVGLGGFAFVVAALVAALGKQDQLVTGVAAGSGIITEFISTVFFYLYSRTVRQLKEYHDSLIKVQNVMLAFRIVETTTDPAAKTAMSRDMLRSLISSAVQRDSLVAASVDNEPRPFP